MAVELSVIVLAYRAEERADEVLVPLYDLLEAEGISYEVVVVANYWSADDLTPLVAWGVARDRPHMHAITRRKRAGMGEDMRAGLRAATGRYLVVIDGDGQVPVEYALEAYRELRATGAALVKGRRYLREDGSVRSVMSLGFNMLFRLLFRTRGLWDVNGRPKGMTREACHLLDLRTDDWFTDAEMLLKARRLGLSVREFPVRFLEHPADSSSVGLDTAWEFARNMTRARLGLHPALRALEIPPGTVDAETEAPVTSGAPTERASP
jgi:glycosyltransferase involved in cell wall biosynthesis